MNWSHGARNLVEVAVKLRDIGMAKKREKNNKLKRKSARVKWYIAIEVLYFKPVRGLVGKGYPTHVNYRLITAISPREAYKKAYALGSVSEGTDCVDERGRHYTWVFAGIETLLPVYDELEDGCEVLWENLVQTMAQIKQRVRSKSELLKQAGQRHWAAK